MNKEELEKVKLTLNTTYYKNELSWFDNSMLEEWRRCPRRFFYRHLKGLIPKGQVEESPLRFGTLIHESFEILYRTQNVTESVEHFVKNYNIQNDPKRSCSRGIEIINGYWAQRKNFIKEYDVLESEIVFEIDFQAWKYRGKIDLILKNKDTNVVQGVDFKTNSWAISTVTNSLEISPQFRGYQLYLTKKYENVSGFYLVDIIQLNPKNTEFYLTPIRVGKEFLDEFDRNVSAETIAITEAFRWGVWPQNAPHACGVFNRTCVYHSLCSQIPEVRERLIEIEFEVKPWEIVLDEMKKQKEKIK